MSRHIPSEKTLYEMLHRGLEREHSYPGKVGGDEGVRFQIKRLRNLLVQWRDRKIKSRDMLEEADRILGGHGVEYIRSEEDDQYDAHGAYYVNQGETYVPTILLDLDRSRVWATSWGDWVETQERQGKRFP